MTSHTPSHTGPADATAETKNRRGWYWPFCIAAFLICTAIFDLTVLAIAANHPTIQVENDYYEKGQRWFADREEQRAIDARGWTVEVDAAPFDRSRNPLELTFHIRDANGAPIDLDHAVVSVFHRARPRDVQRGELESAGSGVHRVIFPIVRPGYHQIRIEGTRGEERFVWTTPRHPIGPRS